jgi:5-methylcytosine-specific restriction endonuclease McrA
MKNHVKIYLNTFDWNEICEVCGMKAVDIHHVTGRGRGKDIPCNLMALCRKCHDKANTKELSKVKLMEIHNKFMGL